MDGTKKVLQKLLNELDDFLTVFEENLVLLNLNEGKLYESNNLLKNTLLLVGNKDGRKQKRQK